MTREEFKKRLEQGPLVLDGAMGTELMKRGLPAGASPEAWLLGDTGLAAVQSVHSDYAAAGSDLIYASTFGGNPHKLAKAGLEAKMDEIFRRAVDAARRAGPDRLVAGDISPLGELLEPYGDFPEDQAREAYLKQARALVSAGVDLLVLETFTDLNEIALALSAAREAAPDLAVIATLAFEGSDRGLKTLMGQTPEQAVERLAAGGADAVGANCGVGVDDTAETVRRMAKAKPGFPLVLKPNAGIPVLKDGKMVFPMDPQEFAQKVAPLAREGAVLLGGCCGTTPEHILELKKKLKVKN